MAIAQAGTGSRSLWWQHETTGALAAWLTDGAAAVAALKFGQVADLAWKIVGSGDFNGDGASDLVWQHQGDGRIAAWLMEGTAVRSTPLLTPGQVSDVNWKIRAVADFNGDGRPDLLWQNVADGRVAVWLMNGTTSLGGTVFRVADLSWRAVDAADISGDGKADILWQNDSDRRLAVWVMDGTTFVWGGLLTPGTISDPAWKMRAVADLNGDARPDLLWQHMIDGRVATWLMEATVMQVGMVLTPAQISDTNWRLAAAR